LERAERTTVITVNAADFIDRNHGLPAEQIIQHLERHGVSAELLQLENIAAWSIAEELQTAARRLGADLMVAGAFGQPRLWERLLGGVTRNLLDRMALPILMSHWSVAAKYPHAARRKLGRSASVLAAGRRRPKFHAEVARKQSYRRFLMSFMV
jgi:hypothetical protein